MLGSRLLRSCLSVAAVAALTASCGGDDRDSRAAAPQDEDVTTVAPSPTTTVASTTTSTSEEAPADDGEVPDNFYTGEFSCPFTDVGIQSVVGESFAKTSSPADPYCFFVSEGGVDGARTDPEGSLTFSVDRQDAEISAIRAGADTKEGTPCDPGGGGVMVVDDAPYGPDAFWAYCDERGTSGVSVNLTVGGHEPGQVWFLTAFSGSERTEGPGLLREWLTALMES